MPWPSIAESDPAYFRLSLVVTVLGFLLVWTHLRTRSGRDLGDDPAQPGSGTLGRCQRDALQDMGAFTLAGFLSGIAGGMLAGYLKGSLNVGDFGV